jgi:hypothetical protein
LIGAATVRRLVLAAAETGRAEIRLWGDVWPGGFDGSGDRVSHRLSLAARAFKAQALAAADLRDAPTAETEVFRRASSGARGWPPAACRMPDSAPR